MVDSLTPQEKVRCRKHMGYINVGQVQTFVLGVPAAVETQFLIEGAMDVVLPEALPLLRKMLDRCDAIEELMMEDSDVMVAEKVGDITINKDEQKQLIKMYDRWVSEIENILGCTRNPFDKRKWSAMSSSGINASVQG